MLHFARVHMACPLAVTAALSSRTWLFCQLPHSLDCAALGGGVFSRYAFCCVHLMALTAVTPNRVTFILCAFG
jgi:hypothetical protein